MLPVLFEAGPIKIYSWGFFLALAYMAGTFILWREGRRQGYKEEKLLDLSVICLAAAIIGGRVLFVLLNWHLFQDNPISSLYFWEGGFAYLGSLVSVLLSGILVLRLWKWPFFQIADITALSATIGLVLGRVGSFLAGLEYGTITDQPWGVRLPGIVGLRHPAALYEAATYLLIFTYLYLSYHHNLSSGYVKSGKVFFAFLLSTSMARIFLELFRAQANYVGPLPLFSLLSLIIAIFAIVALYYFQIRSFREDARAFLKNFLVLNEKVLRRFGFNK